MFCSFEIFKINSNAKLWKILMFPNIFVQISKIFYKLYKNIPLFPEKGYLCRVLA